MKNLQKRDTVCPFCGYRHDSTTSAYGNRKSQPAPGDLTLCIECGEFAIFATIPGGLRKPTDAEYGDFGTAPEVQAVRAAWLAVSKDRKK